MTRPRFWFSGAFLLLSAFEIVWAKETTAQKKTSQVLEKEVSPPNIGDLVPDFKLQDKTGHWHKLSDFRGNIVFLNFWATWCPPCVGELPLLDSLNKKLKAKNFTMIAVSIDENWSTINHFFKDRAVSPSFLVLLDSNKEVVGTLYGTHKYPESYLIDTQGRLLKKYIGAYDWLASDKLEDIDEALSKKTQ